MADDKKKDSDHKKGGLKGHHEEILLIALGVGGVLFAYLAWKSEQSSASSTGSSSSTTPASGVQTLTYPVSSSGNSSDGGQLSSAINNLTSYLQSASPGDTGVAPAGTTPPVVSYSAVNDAPGGITSGGTQLAQGTELYLKGPSGYFGAGSYDPTKGPQYVSGLAPAQTLVQEGIPTQLYVKNTTAASS